MTETNEATTTTNDLIRTSKEAADSASKLFSSVKSAAALAQKVAREQLSERPYTTLGVAAGAGFVIAGGLASSVTRGIVSAGTKLATAVVLDKVVSALGALGGPAPGGEAAPAEPAKQGSSTMTSADAPATPQEFSELAAPH